MCELVAVARNSVMSVTWVFISSDPREVCSTLITVQATSLSLYIVHAAVLLAWSYTDYSLQPVPTPIYRVFYVESALHYIFRLAAVPCTAYAYY